MLMLRQMEEVDMAITEDLTEVIKVAVGQVAAIIRGVVVEVNVARTTTVLVMLHSVVSTSTVEKQQNMGAMVKVVAAAPEHKDVVVVEVVGVMAVETLVAIVVVVTIVGERKEKLLYI